MKAPNALSPGRPAGFTLMEILVVVAIIMVLVAIGVPVYRSVRQNSYKASALSKMQQIGAMFIRYANENNGVLPVEDAQGNDDWANAEKPESANVWYNALPKLAGQRNVADYAREPEAFYRNDNLLWLPGAAYPDLGKAIAEPVFAFAMNSRLQRRQSADKGSAKPDTRLANIQKPSRTVAFMECGIKGEKKALPAQPGYNGKPKANGRAFVARYNDTGIICFVDGHGEALKVQDVLDQTGHMIYPQNDIIWTPDPQDDPNEKPSAATP